MYENITNHQKVCTKSFSRIIALIKWIDNNIVLIYIDTNMCAPINAYIGKNGFCWFRTSFIDYLVLRFC